MGAKLSDRSGIPDNVRHTKIRGDGAKSRRLSTRAGGGTGGRSGTSRKILCLLPHSLAGFVRALGPARELRRFFNSARITVLTHAGLHGLAHGCPSFDESDFSGAPADNKAFAALVARIRAQKYDVIIDWRADAFSKRIHDALWLSRPAWSSPAGAKDRVGPTLSAYALQLNALGVRDQNDAPWSQPPRPDMSWARAAQRDAPRMQPEHSGLSGPFALFALGPPESFEGKAWPEKRFGELCARMAARGLVPVIIGAESERDAAAAISRACPHARSLIGRLDYFQIACLAEKAAAVVGTEAGVFHLALAAGAPGVALYTTSSLPTAPIAPARQVIMLHAAEMETIGAAEVESALSALGAFDSAPRLQPRAGNW